jgi:hypothetical protein
MKTLRLVLALLLFVPAFALLGGLATLDSGAIPWVGTAAGALVGVCFGLVFGGVRGGAGRWLDANRQFIAQRSTSFGTDSSSLR